MKYLDVVVFAIDPGCANSILRDVTLSNGRADSGVVVVAKQLQMAAKEGAMGNSRYILTSRAIKFKETDWYDERKGDYYLGSC
jgi:hypothetical protein